MIIESLVVGPFQVNCYVVYPGPGFDAVVIDPGDDPEEILSLLSSRRLNVTHIINTHGHGDHIGANRPLKEAFPLAKIAIHHRDAHMLTDARANFSLDFNFTVTSPPADLFLEGNTELSAAGTTFRIEHVPGHSPGSICIIPDFDPRVVFTGDALFAGSIGRTDFPGGNMGLLVASINDKILTLPGDTVVCPGHGVRTTVEVEKRNNPYLSARAGTDEPADSPDSE